jgi:hypothetical protein
VNIPCILIGVVIFIVILVVTCAFVLNSMIDEWEDKNKEDK